MIARALIVTLLIGCGGKEDPCPVQSGAALEGRCPRYGATACDPTGRLQVCMGAEPSDGGLFWITMNDWKCPNE